jgi:hypothetical protein
MKFGNEFRYLNKGIGYDKRVGLLASNAACQLLIPTHHWPTLLSNQVASNTDTVARFGEKKLKSFSFHRFFPAWVLFSSQKILQFFSDFPSHRIFRHVHEALNIDKK